MYNPIVPHAYMKYSPPPPSNASSHFFITSLVTRVKHGKIKNFFDQMYRFYIMLSFLNKLKWDLYYKQS